MTEQNEITESIARKVLTTIDAGLVAGKGVPTPGQMCVEAAVCYALGLPHGDNPECVAPALRALKIRLNDSRWSSTVARAQGLRRLGLIQLGSAGHLDEEEFARRCARLAIQTSVPQALRAAASLYRDGTAVKERLLTAADLCERDPGMENARIARDAAYAADAAADAAAANAAYAADAAAYAADANAAYAAAYAAYAAAYAAVYAAYNAADAADAAAYAADAAYAANAAYAADARDRSLAAFSEGVVQILVAMKVPGCAWLYLTEGRSDERTGTDDYEPGP
jgi:hypothetical protein